MPNALILAIAAGALSACMYLTFLSGAFGVLLIVYFAQLPLFAVGLILGIGSTAIAASAASAIVLVAGGLAFGLTYAIVNAAPALFIVRQALLNRIRNDGTVEWYPPGQLVAWLCGLGVALFALTVLIVSGQDGGLEGIVKSAVRGTFEGNRESGAPTGAEAETLAAAMQIIAKILPGMVFASWIGMNAVNGALAQLIARTSGYALRPSPDMAELDLPSWIPAATAIAGLGAIIGGTPGFLGINALMIFGLAFVFAGLAVIHARSRSWNQRGPLLGAIYALSFIFAWPILFIGLLGVIEPWANLRGRPAGPPPQA